jgi:methyl-accepting chemotaxis protein
MRVLAAIMALMAAVSLIGAWALHIPDAMPGMIVALLLPALPLVLALRGRIDAATRLLVTMTLVAQPAVMLYLFRGEPWQVDLHMLFFAALAAAAILCDWRALVAGTLVVAVHHLALGMLVPDWLFTNGGGLGRVLLHAVVLVVEAGALIMLASQMAGRMASLSIALDRETEERSASEAAGAADRVAHAAELELVIDSVTASLSGLAAGDLTRGIASPLPPAYAALESHFEVAVASLRGLIGSVSQGTQAIRLASGEIANTSEDLAKRTQSAANTLETTNEAVTEIDRLLTGTAQKSETVVSRADQALATVAGSRVVADDVVTAMGRVSESAKGIDQVIEGLDKIAFQTRVLAMNAAVEAGRAGDAGRGFAVVADLVSALAMRAEDEAKRAHDQLSVTQADIVSAVDAVGKVDGALAHISDDVGEVHQLLGAIASDNKHQATAVTRIAEAMKTMEVVTQQNAAMVEQTSATARSLTVEIEDLADKTAQFRVETAARPVLRPSRSGVSLH